MSDCKHPQGFGDDSLCYECGEDSSDVVFKLQAELAALKKLTRGFVEANTTIQYWHMKAELRAALQEKGE